MLRAAILTGTALALAGCGGERDEAPRPQQEQEAPAALLATVSEADDSGNAVARLARLDPETLAPRGPTLELGEYHDTWSLSPDGGRVALGISAPPPGGGGRIGLRIASTTDLRFTRDVQTGIVAEAVGWLAPDRVAALLQSGEVVVVDPDTGAILTRRRVPVSGFCGGFAEARSRNRLVLLLAGPPRVAVVNAAGRVRVARLRRLGRRDCTSLALTADARRAYAAGRGGALATVDLATLRVTYRGGVRRGAERRTLAALGGGRLATAARDARERPLGAELVDLATGRRRTLAARAGEVLATRGALLVFDGGRPGPRGIGLRVFGRDGSLRYRAAAGERVWDVDVAGDRLYVRAGRRLRVLALADGRVLSSSPASEDEIELLAP